MLKRQTVIQTKESNSNLSDPVSDTPTIRDYKQKAGRDLKTDGPHISLLKVSPASSDRNHRKRYAR